MAHPNVDVVRKAFGARCEAQVVAWAEAALDPEVTLHYPGRSVVAGTFHGPDSVEQWIRRRGEIGEARGTWRLNLIDVFADDERGVALFVTGTEFDGKTVFERWTAVLGFRDGKISEVWLTPDDLYASDELVSSSA